MSRISAEKVLSSAKNMMDFIHASPSPYHVVEVCRKRLIGAGFTELSEKNAWNITKVWTLLLLHISPYDQISGFVRPNYLSNIGQGVN